MKHLKFEGRIVLILFASLMLLTSCTKKGKNVEGETQKNGNLSASGNELKIEVCPLLEKLDFFHQYIGNDGFCTLREIQGMRLICNVSIPVEDGIPTQYYIFGYDSSIGEIKVYGNNDPEVIPCALSEHACCLIVLGPTHFALLFKNENDYNGFLRSTEDYGRIIAFEVENNGEKLYYYVSPKQKLSKEELAKEDFEDFWSPAYCPAGLDENGWYQIYISNDY